MTIVRQDSAVIMDSSSQEVSDTDEKTKSVVESLSPGGGPSKTQKADWWIWEMLGVVISGVAIAGMAILLKCFNGKPSPNWSYTYSGPGALNGKSAHISFNAILSILSTVVRIFLLIPITRGLAQLKWVRLAEKERALADLNDFDQASRQGLLNSVKLVWTLKGRYECATIPIQRCFQEMIS